MVKARAEQFEKFTQEQNEDAKYAMFRRGLGITSETLETPRSQISEKIAAALETADLDEETAMTLRELLEAEIAPFVKQENDTYISMLDVTTLGLTEDSKIRQFLKNHGIDLENPDDLEYAGKIIKEAVEFFNKRVGSKNLRINKDLVNLNKRNLSEKDIYKIFKTAAGQDHKKLIPQACALLRIITVIDYLERDPLLSMAEAAENKIRDFERDHIKKNTNPDLQSKGHLVFQPNGGKGVPIVKFEPRVKEKWRMIAKLLHKPENVSKHVLDHVGFRITTKSSQLALAFIYELFHDPKEAILPAAYIRPSETTNLLIDANAIAETSRDPRKAAKLFKQLSEETIDHEELRSNDKTNGNNKHSSKKYRAIHFTVDMPIVVNRHRRLFPIEIQVLHEQAWIDNKISADHESYVARQMETVKERVLGNNLSTAFDEQDPKKDKQPPSSHP
ncbi:MAG: TIGR04552 family protein [Patescibacteria group bacterium]|nr:TIGR04552 family protein [Patescibacteria group bacterium]